MMASNNLICNNNFIDNNNGGIQCIDNGTNTRWNLSTQGNYWSDWTTPDANTDGIVDNPYNIAGTAGAKDYYPRTKAIATKKIQITPNDITSTNEDTPYSVQYKTSDTLIPAINHIWTYKSNATWLAFNGATNVVSGTPDNSDVGSYWVNVTATDTYTTDFHNFTLTVLNVNDPPVIDTLNDGSVLEDENYLVDYNATDIDPTNDVISWSIKTNATFLSLDAASGNLTGTPDNADVDEYYVNVTASDGNGGSDFSNFTLNVIGANDPPILTNDTLPVCIEDQEFSMVFNATDEEQTWDTLDWELETNATFLSFNTTSLTLSGTPDNGDVGKFSVEINLSDDLDAFKSLRFDLIVQNTAPEIVTTDVVDSTANQLYSVDYNSTDDGQGNIAWTLSTSAGEWLSIDESTGNLSGTPADADAGVYWVCVNVSDGNGGFDETNFTLTVSSVAGPPFIDLSMPDINMLEDTIYYIDLTMWFKDPKNDPLTFRSEGYDNITVEILTNGSAKLTPKADWVGIENIEFFANDSISEISDTIKVTVTNVNDAPENVDFILPTEKWYDGESKTLTGSATDPDLDYADELTYTWYVDGIKVKEGKETQLTLATGNHVIKLSVEDKAGANATKQQNIMVYPGEPSDDDDTSNMAFIIAGIVGGIVLLLIVVGIIVFIMIRKKKTAEKPPEQVVLPPAQPSTESMAPAQPDEQSAQILPEGQTLGPPMPIEHQPGIERIPSSNTQEQQPFDQSITSSNTGHQPQTEMQIQPTQPIPDQPQMINEGSLIVESSDMK